MMFSFRYMPKAGTLHCDIAHFTSAGIVPDSLVRHFGYQDTKCLWFSELHNLNKLGV
jgi:hypothetical protein